MARFFSRAIMVLLVLSMVAFPLALPGCGSESTPGEEGRPVDEEAYADAREALVDFIIAELIIPTSKDYDVFGDNQPLKQIVTLYTDEAARDKDNDDMTPGDDGIEKIILLENGDRREISKQELEELTKVTDYDFSNPDLQEGYDFMSSNYPYSFHSIQIYKLDLETGKAKVEIGNTFGPLWGYGVIYRLELQEDGWKVKGEQQAWIS